MEVILQNFDLVIFLFLLCLGYVAGSIAEKRHYKSILQREDELLKLPVVTAEARFSDGRVQKAELVTGSAVISIDYFKRLLAILRNIFGGRVGAYETLVDRARREAILRMKQAARDQGAGMIVNMRLETAAIGNNANGKRQIASVEAIAYGTAIVFNPK